MYQPIEIDLKKMKSRKNLKKKTKKSFTVELVDC